MSEGKNDVVAQKETAPTEGEATRVITEFLKTENGNALANRVLDFFATSKDAGTNHAKFNLLVRSGVVLAVILAVVFLTYFGRFDPAVGVLMGTLVGFIFGRK